MWLDRLNEMKKQRGVTLKDISEGAGISIGTVNKLFSGQTDDPKIGTLRPIVHFMGYTLDDLEEKETPPAEAEGVTPEEVAEALVAAGFIRPGQDLDDADLRFLMSVGEMIQAWFGYGNDLT